MAANQPNPDKFNHINKSIFNHYIKTHIFKYWATPPIDLQYYLKHVAYSSRRNLMPLEMYIYFISFFPKACWEQAAILNFQKCMVFTPILVNKAWNNHMVS